MESKTTQPAPARLVIIGGGITGLAAAHRIAERAVETGQKIELILLEAGSQLGGTIRTQHRDGFLLEAGPDSFISEKPEALELVRRVGLESNLLETNKEHRRSFIVRDGRIRPVPEGFQLLAPERFWPFITSDVFSLAGKARMALDLVIPRRANYNGSADESLAQFVRRRLGREALERMAQPMVGGIYTADPEKLSLRATLPRFLEMEHEDGSVIRAIWKRAKRQDAEETRRTSGARYSLFLSFDLGMQVLVDRLASRLPAGTVRLKKKVESLTFDHLLKHWEIKVRDNESIFADAVCLAIPAYVAADLLGETDQQLSAALAAISYASTATVNLAYKRADIRHALDGFGFVVPFIEKRSLLACTFCSVKFTGRAPADCVLLRAFVGGALQPEVFALDEAEIVVRVRADLRDLLGLEAAPRFSVVEKWINSMPQYHVGHLDRVSRIRSHLRALPTLRLAGNAYAGAGIPDCIRSGEKAAEALFTLLS